MREWTTKDLVMFILKYRKYKAFVDWSVQEIIQYILWCTQEHTLCYCTSETEITGVMVGEIHDNKYHVTNILSTKRNMPFFIGYIINNFPEVTKISTLRHGRFYKEYPLTKENIKRFMKGTK